ncbi:uncharacterized protein VNE69_02163 [Vairimorpha necatrix]|uniref:Uncharacterized protein n=1 Tax=Vairimorpha necatrix TaxID=6039 RepID=A0AAX4J9M1_9MICR
MNIKLYMILELEKIQLNHIEGIWVRPFRPLVFQVYVIKNMNVYELYISKNTIRDKWSLKSSSFLFSHYEVLDMLREINLIFLDLLEMFKINFRPGNIEISIKSEYNNKMKINNSIKLQEDYKKISSNLLDNITK